MKSDKNKKYLVINFKTYDESFDKKCIKLIKIVKKLKSTANKLNVEIIVCPNQFDIKEVKNHLNKNIFFQSISNFNFGANTGHIPIDFLKNSKKINGTLINHSENRITTDLIKTQIKILKKIGKISIVCTQTLNEAQKIDPFSPNFIAYEPKNLIGGDISVSTEKPEIIDEFNKYIKTKLLVGAGIKNKNDVKKSLELGAVGVLVASGVVKSKNPKKAILDLLEGFKV